MPRIGAVNNTNTDGNLGNFHRMLVTGIDAAVNTGGTLDSIELFINRGSGAGNADNMRLGLYYGGVSDTDMDGAIKIADIDFPNMSANNGLTDIQQWITLPFGGETIPAGERLWVAYIQDYYINGGNVNPAGPDIGDMLSQSVSFPQYRYDGAGGDPNLPATLNPLSDGEVPQFPIKVAVNYTEAAGGPVITVGATTAITPTTATGNVSTDTVEGTMWGGVWPDAATPDIAAIKAGTGAVAGTASSQVVTGASLTAPVTGLTENTAYKFHFVQEDASANDSNQDEDAFSTLAEPKQIEFLVSNGNELRDENGTLIASESMRWEWYNKTTDTNGDPDDSGTGTITAGETTLNLTSGPALGAEGIAIIDVDSDPLWHGIFRMTVT